MNLTHKTRKIIHRNQNRCLKHPLQVWKTQKIASSRKISEESKESYSKWGKVKLITAYYHVIH